MAERKENRTTPRIQPYVVPCRIQHAGQQLPGYVMDLSSRGARVTCETAPPAVGQVLVLDVRLARRHGQVRLPARVLWSRPLLHPTPGHEFGVTFEGLLARVQEVLETVVKDFHRHAEQLAR
jgi:hypothetical protein